MEPTYFSNFVDLTDDDDLPPPVPEPPTTKGAGSPATSTQPKPTISTTPRGAKLELIKIQNPFQTRAPSIITKTPIKKGVNKYLNPSKTKPSIATKPVVDNSVNKSSGNEVQKYVFVRLPSQGSQVISKLIPLNVTSKANAPPAEQASKIIDQSENVIVKSGDKYVMVTPSEFAKLYGNLATVSPGQKVQGSPAVQKNTQSVAPNRKNIERVTPIRKNIQSVAPNRKNIERVTPIRKNIQSVAPNPKNVESATPIRKNIKSVAPIQQNSQGIPPPPLLNLQSRQKSQSILPNPKPANVNAKSMGSPAPKEAPKRRKRLKDKADSNLTFVATMKKLTDIPEKPAVVRLAKGIPKPNILKPIRPTDLTDKIRGDTIKPPRCFQVYKNLTSDKQPRKSQLVVKPDCSTDIVVLSDNEEVDLPTPCDDMATSNVEPDNTEVVADPLPILPIVEEPEPIFLAEEIEETDMLMDYNISDTAVEQQIEESPMHSFTTVDINQILQKNHPPKVVEPSSTSTNQIVVKRRAPRDFMVKDRCVSPHTRSRRVINDTLEKGFSQYERKYKAPKCYKQMISMRESLEREVSRHEARIKVVENRIRESKRRFETVFVGGDSPKYLPELEPEPESADEDQEENEDMEFFNLLRQTDQEISEGATGSMQMQGVNFIKKGVELLKKWSEIKNLKKGNGRRVVEPPKRRQSAKIEKKSNDPLVKKRRQRKKVVSAEDLVQEPPKKRRRKRKVPVTLEESTTSVNIEYTSSHDDEDSYLESDLLVLKKVDILDKTHKVVSSVTKF